MLDGVWRGCRAMFAGALSVLCALAVVAGLTSCSGARAQIDPADDRPVVLTTFTVIADMARNVAGPHVRIESITKAGAEIHGYEPTPGDIRRAADADLILDNGLNLEAWFAQFVAGLDVPHVVVSEGVEPIEIAAGSGSGRPNPHAWMSPLNAQIYVANIVAALSELDPSHAEAFAANGERYRAQLQEIHDSMAAELARVPADRRALVTCEGAFSYLARDAGLTERFLWEVNAEQQATPQQIAATIEFVAARGVPAVFCESTVSDAAMRQVVEATGAVFGGTLYVDSLSEPDGPVPTYLDLLTHDAALIVAGLATEGA